MAKQQERNFFGKVSTVRLKAQQAEQQTVLTDVEFTAPYKIMQPFPLADGGIQVMLLSASAGIMEGDRQYFSLEIGSGAKMEFVSQAYEKLHQMGSGCAQRTTEIEIASGGELRYNPLPTIPFAESAFRSKTVIKLADETAKLQFSEIFSCGRYMRGEYFKYREFSNLVEIYCGEKLIYRDNTRYFPAKMPMAEYGMYEGYTHMGNMFISKSSSPADLTEQLHDLIQQHSEHYPGELIGDITVSNSGDYIIRALAKRAQYLEVLIQDIYREL